MSSSNEVQPSSGDELSKLPIRKIPGDYGIPFIGPIRDRLDYFYNQGRDEFFRTRMTKYGSTVFRAHMPPGPFMARDPRVIVLLDAASFPVLFDVTKVEKRDVFTGTYMPSTSLTGGYRAIPYLDPSEPKHALIKQLLFQLLSTRKPAFIPEFTTSFTALFDTLESDIAENGRSDFNSRNDIASFVYISQAYFGVDPISTELGSDGPTIASKWLFFQLHPLITLGKLPNIIEDLLLHTFHFPPFLIRSDYKTLYNFFYSASSKILDRAEEMGLQRDEACHNILFATCFNTFGGMKVFFPALMKHIAQAGESLHRRLADEVRSAVKSNGGEVMLSAIDNMPLTKSAVYEALRIEPPVMFQYGKAKKDLIVESHDAAFKVKKGEMLFGFQPFATKDPKIFDNAEAFVADRFLGEGEKKLLRYVLWSNGPETEDPTVGNKQCPGKDFVVLIGRLLLVEFFLRYDTFSAETGTLLLGSSVTVTSLTKRTEK